MGLKLRSFSSHLRRVILTPLDNDYVKLFIYSIVFFWLFSLFHYKIHLVNLWAGEKGIGFMARYFMLINAVSFFILFLLFGVILGISLKNKLILKSLFSGSIVAICIVTCFPYFILYVHKYSFLSRISNLIYMYYLYPIIAFPLGSLIVVFTLLRKIHKTFKLTLIFITYFLFLWLLSSNVMTYYTYYFSQRNSENTYHNVVESFASLKENLSLPDEITRDKLEFNINKYFDVLSHLSMGPGYTLNYAYFFDSNGFPIIYAHKIEDPSLRKIKDYEEARGKISKEEYWARIYGKSGTDYDKKMYRYMNHIKINDTPEGYFQFVLLRLMGSQFYLFWHSHYNDQKIICDYPAFKMLVSQLRGDRGLLDPWSLIYRAAGLDFTPVIKIEEKSVKIQVIVFSKWGGFVQNSFELSRGFPHKILKEEKTTIIQYNCGRVF